MKIIPNEKIIYIKIMNYYFLKHTKGKYDFYSNRSGKIGEIKNKEYNNLILHEVIKIVSQEEYESNI